MDTMAIIAALTRAEGRKSLYHFTRAGNLPAIAHFDALLSSHAATRDDTGERRLSPMTVNHDGQAVTVNAHLRIPERMMADGCTVEIFRAHLNRHVFFWPTRRDCLKMLDTYSRREPDGRFALLELDAASLLAANSAAVRLSKYDSGSSPRFPQRCTYRKSPDMFLPLAEFGRPANAAVPAKSSEVKEVLVEDRVSAISRYLKTVYAMEPGVVPDRWAGIAVELGAFVSPD